MTHCAIVGINWGDEGKGRMVDYLAENYDVVIRYQGGNNAGHTVVNEYGEFKLNLLPSGIFRPEKINLLGAGTVIDLKHLCGEIDRLRSQGVVITPDNLKISDRAMMVLPFHPLQDKLEELRLGKDSYGSTLRGISPIYGDKYMKKALEMGDLLYPESVSYTHLSGRSHRCRRCNTPRPGARRSPSRRRGRTRPLCVPPARPPQTRRFPYSAPAGRSYWRARPCPEGRHDR